MSRALSDIVRAGLPAPFNAADFGHLRTGIYDDAEVSVFVSADGSFAVLDPRPDFDYADYQPRGQKLGLSGYKKTLNVVAQRFGRIGDAFPATGTVLEVGAAEGGFLAYLGEQRPNVRRIAVEPDRATAAVRGALKLDGDFDSLEAAAAAGVKADIVCLFHVFEHIAEPKGFIAALKAVLAPGGRIVIEVPALSDPLLSLYQSAAYQAFYFQRQHPLVYSGASLQAVLEANGLRVAEIRPYQRYGIENHMGWLKTGKPGGDAMVAETFAGIADGYRAALEAKGLTDTVFAIAEAP